MTSSPERAWAPPALRRGSEPRSATADGPWRLPDLGAPPAPAPPRDASYESGHADGLRAGASAATEQLRPALLALHGAVRALDERRAEILGDRTRDVQALALAVARRIVQHEVKTDAALLSEWIARALELLPHDLHIEVRLHPADLEVIGTAREGVVPADSGVTLRWIADASIDRAGFVVQSPQRLVDGRLDVALRGLYERFDAD
jgi:flagellar assembly protein FliH